MNRRILMTAMAVILALVGAGAVYSYTKNADSRAVAGKQPIDVLIVIKRIPAGTAALDVRTGDYLQVDHVPAEANPQGSVTQIATDWESEVATADIQPGQVVLRDMFGTKVATTSGLAIPGGMIAVSVKLSTEGDVAGFVQPGSQIAIFDTFILLPGKKGPSGTTSGSGGSENWATKLLLPRVDVLAVSQAAPTSTKAGLDANSVTAILLVTVAVKQADAERLIHVAQTGMPYAALLSDGSNTATAPGVDNQSRLGPVFAGGITTP